MRPSDLPTAYLSAAHKREDAPTAQRPLRQRANPQLAVRLSSSARLGAPVQHPRLGHSAHDNGRASTYGATPLARSECGCCAPGGPVRLQDFVSMPLAVVSRLHRLTSIEGLVVCCHLSMN